MITVYTLRQDAYCDRCGTDGVETTESESNRNFPHVTEKQNLCCFCYETLLGNVLDYPEQYPGQTTLVQGLIQALHIIRRDIKKE